MAAPIWNESEKRWILRIQRENALRKFTCVKAGMAGKREVLRRAREWVDGGKSERRTVAEEWTRFLADTKMRGSLENYRNIESIGRNYIAPKCGRARIMSMRPTDWQTIINGAEGQRPLSKKSLSNLRGVIISFLRYAQRDGAIEAVPDALYVPKNAPVIGKQILQPEQVKRLFSAYDDEWLIYLWRFILVTGLRPGEALGLQASDFDGASITIRRSVNACGRITAGKNANAARTIQLHDIAIGILAQQKTRVKSLKSKWLFPNRSGDQPLQSVAYKGWRRIADDMQIKVTPYGLRHTFISMVKNDLPEQMIKSIVGHSAAMDTFGVYGHEVDGDKAAAAKILNIALARKLS